MTVKELIKKLKELPEDLEVINYEGFDIYDVEIDEEFRDEKVVMIS